jgi:hypothetical protein
VIKLGLSDESKGFFNDAFRKEVTTKETPWMPSSLALEASKIEQVPRIWRYLCSYMGLNDDTPREVRGARSITIICPAKTGLSFCPFHHEVHGHCRAHTPRASQPHRRHWP